MTKGSKASGNSASNAYAISGYVSSAPVKAGSSGKASYQNTSQISYSDKETGCYQKATTKVQASGGEFQWKNGTTGTRSEYKQSETVRVGDKGGYTEVYSEQRVRNVIYDTSNVSSKDYISNDNGHGGRGYITYDNGHGGRGYGGYY